MQVLSEQLIATHTRGDDFLLRGKHEAEWDVVYLSS